jgi:hypothetical protein
MAFVKLTPPPPTGIGILDRWLALLWRLLTADGQIPWNTVNKEGSDLNDLETANHNDLDNIQGGTGSAAFEETAFETSVFQVYGSTTSEHYHLTLAEYSELQRDGVSVVAVNTVLDDTYRTVMVSATAKTITLPAASAARVGKDWTVILGTNGYCDIAAAGADTLTLPTNDTIIRLNNKGASVSLRCLSSTSWGIV